MKHWPYLSIVASLLAGMLVGKLSATSHSVDVNSVSLRTEKETLPLPPSLIMPRQQARGALATGVLDKVQFEKIQDDKVTPIARHLLALTDSECAGIESALAVRESADIELDQQLALKATVTENTPESVVIDLPDDAEARHAISLGCWESVSEVVGARWAGKMLGARPEFQPWQVRRRILTLKPNGNAESLECTEVKGERYSPRESMTTREFLSEPWPGILKRLDL